MLKVSVPTLQEISSIDQDQKVTINCVMQKGLMDRYEELNRKFGTDFNERCIPDSVIIESNRGCNLRC